MNEQMEISRENMKILIKQAQSGDERALSAIYTNYYTPIYRYIYSRINHRGQAEDLTQTVFLKIYQALDRIDPERVHPIAYFYTVARNTLIDHYRKGSHEPIYNDEILIVEDETKDSGESAKDKEVKDLVESGLKILGDEHKEIITLRFINDMSTKEIAEIVGKSDDAVRQILSRATKILREHFDKLN